MNTERLMITKQSNCNIDNPEEQHIYDTIKPFVSREKTRGTERMRVRLDLIRLVLLAEHEVFD